MIENIAIIIFAGLLAFLGTALHYFVKEKEETDKLNKIKKNKGFRLYEWTGTNLDNIDKTRKSKGIGYFINEDSLRSYLLSQKIILFWFQDITP